MSNNVNSGSVGMVVYTVPISQESVELSLVMEKFRRGSVAGSEMDDVLIFLSQENARLGRQSN